MSPAPFLYIPRMISWIDAIRTHDMFKKLDDLDCRTHTSNQSDLKCYLFSRANIFNTYYIEKTNMQIKENTKLLVYNNYSCCMHCVDYILIASYIPSGIVGGGRHSNHSTCLLPSFHVKMPPCIHYIDLTHQLN